MVILNSINKHASSPRQNRRKCIKKRKKHNQVEANTRAGHGWVVLPSRTCAAKRDGVGRPGGRAGRRLQQGNTDQQRNVALSDENHMFKAIHRLVRGLHTPRTRRQRATPRTAPPRGRFLCLGERDNGNGCGNVIVESRPQVTQAGF